MKRKNLLTVAACMNKRFDNLALRDQLPFETTPLTAKGRQHSDYTLPQAFQLRVMLDLLENQGLSLEVSQYVAGNCLRHLREATERYGYEDIWLVFAQDRQTTSGDAAGLVNRMLKATTLADLPRLIEEEIQPEDHRYEVALIALVNATAISQFVTIQALANAVISADSFDFEPLWLTAGSDVVVE